VSIIASSEVTDERVWLISIGWSVASTLLKLQSRTAFMVDALWMALAHGTGFHTPSPLTISVSLFLIVQSFVLSLGLTR
jgi:hypothetical protein